MSEIRQYTCELCGGTFRTDQPLEEVLAETRENFGHVPDAADQGTVCDDCYRDFKAWLDAKSPEERAALDQAYKEHLAAREQPP